MNIFEHASRIKLRFESGVGLLTAEQVWDLPLIATGNKANLDAMARAASKELRDLGEESFVELKPDPRKAVAELKLDIIKHVIAVKLAEKSAREKAAETLEQKRKLLAALDSKQTEKLSNMSEEQIRAEIAKLGA